MCSDCSVGAVSVSEPTQFVTANTGSSGPRGGEAYRPALRTYL